MINKPEIPEETILIESLKPDLNIAKDAHNMISDFSVISNEDLSTAVALTAEVKRKYKHIDQKRRAIIDALHTTMDQVNAVFGPTLETISNTEIALKDKIVQCVENRYTQRDKLLLNPKKTRDILDKAEELLPPKIEGLTIREAKKGTVVDKEAFIQWAIKNSRPDCLKPDDSPMKKFIRISGQDPEIPGYEMRIVRTVAITVAKTLNQ
jgi:hypothetical protein